jgi:very-short-patch-repair endonuclease
MSYIEQWFFDSVIIKHSLLKKYDIINEYPEYPYFIDFVFLNVKLAIELDGKQHFRNIKNQNRDIKKQALLVERGWKVYRIRFNELTQEKISDFLNTLNNVGKYETKILECRLYKFAEHKLKNIQSKEEYFKKRKNEYAEKEKENIFKIRSSNIDFTKYGWVTLVAKLIKKHHQKIHRWMKNFCPDILETAYESVQCLKSEHKYVKSIKKGKVPFHKLEKFAVEKGYHFDGCNNVISHKGKILKIIYNKSEYPFINITYNNTVKHIKIHRLKAYILYGDNIYKENSQIYFKDRNKLNWIDSNIAFKENPMLLRNKNGKFIPL